MKITTQAEFLKKFKEVQAESYKIVEPKNLDYAGGDDAFRNLRRHGLYGVLVRMDDKISRLNSFVERGSLHVKSESARETALDLQNYANIFVQMLDELTTDDRSRVKQGIMATHDLRKRDIDEAAPVKDRKDGTCTAPIVDFR